MEAVRARVVDNLRIEVNGVIFYSQDKDAAIKSYLRLKDELIKQSKESSQRS